MSILFRKHRSYTLSICPQKAPVYFRMSWPPYCENDDIVSAYTIVTDVAGRVGSSFTSMDVLAAISVCVRTRGQK
jgi:hypothetical protein